MGYARGADKHSCQVPGKYCGVRNARDGEVWKPRFGRFELVHKIWLMMSPFKRQLTSTPGKGLSCWFARLAMRDQGSLDNVRRAFRKVGAAAGRTALGDDRSTVQAQLPVPRSG